MKDKIIKSKAVITADMLSSTDTTVDELLSKDVCEAQLYKQAGNSIVVKEALELNKYFAIEYFSKSGEPKIFTFTDILTLINELEGENERLLEQRNKTYNIWVKDTEQLKNRIAELTKEKDEQLKHFVERLKEKADGLCIRNDILYAIKSSELDETLKEFLDGKV